MELKTFNLSGKLIRYFVDESNKNWFIAKDVCDFLGKKNARDLVMTLDRSEFSKVTAPSSFGNRLHYVISEKALLKLTGNKALPKADNDIISNYGDDTLISYFKAKELRISNLEKRIQEIENKLLKSVEQPISALSFLIKNSLPTDSTTVLQFGKMASIIANETGVEIHKIPDQRYGSVNGFNESFFKKVSTAYFGSENEESA